MNQEKIVQCQKAIKKLEKRIVFWREKLNHTHPDVVSADRRRILRQLDYLNDELRIEQSRLFYLKDND